MQRRTFLASLMAICASGSRLVKANLFQDKTRSINGGGITFDVPTGWKSAKPSSSMRRAQLVIPPVEGDKDSCEVVLFAFPGGAGSVDANIERWAGQFKGANDAPPKPLSKVLKGQNTEVTHVEISGRYVAPLMPGSRETVDKPNYKLLGAIVVTPEVSYFLKAVGPDATMKAASKDFDALIASMKLAE
jgi:hypothetical protein